MGALAWLAATALAGVWEPGSATVLPVDGPISAIAVAPFDGRPAVWVGGPEGLSVRSPEGVEQAAVALPIAALVSADLDGDGGEELIACGPAGLHALRGGQATLAEPIALSDQPCVAVAAATPAAATGLPALAHLLTWDGSTARVWRPGGDGLVAEALVFDAVDGALWVAGSAGRFAVASGAWMLEADAAWPADPPPVARALDGPVRGLASDGEGFAVALGGEVPALLLASGERVPLPSEPAWLRGVELAARGDLTVGLADGGLWMRAGDRPLEAVQMPLGAARIAVGDLDGDGCRELIVADGDGSASVVAGRCSNPPPAGLALLDGDLTLGREWAQLTVEVGQAARVQLIDGLSGWTGFERRGGPDSIVVGTSGLLELTPTEKDVGIWRLSIRITNGESERWSGVVLRVRAGTAAAPVRVPAEVKTVSEVAPGDRNNVVAVGQRKSPFGFRECLASAGVAAGLSRNEQDAWSNIGLPDVVPSASPAMAIACGGGSRKVHALVGIDAAPTFFYLTSGGRMNHLLAATLGLELRAGRLRFGPFVSAGFVIVGGGLRAVALPFETKRGGLHGIEARLTTYPANLSAQAMLAYTWEFGEF